ncbi:hypothetical protein TpMuguga_04g00346 [Theileria parva strain Muguga]|uniref:Uncharacterized protein n=1 Tax=Theileria parva TaxID=5875 RepID=Q4N2K3_THEPA|nr:uncharacterized protein TpMuguga_04g00346 [Theileria parva strain Muguga]EAN31698.1 hypothetical protein TpMuguga_04g00346 [Theileria parva strain Muguga]|eukprot:XP_763981.1 hypothetical protein [Theileria parva strain Muguga]
MRRDWLKLNQEDSESDCSCSCEESDSSESCSCEYESLSSSEPESPKHFNRSSKVGKNELNGFHSHDESTQNYLKIDNCFVNNNNSDFSGVNNQNLTLKQPEPGCNLCKNSLNPELNLPNIDLNSTYIQNELKEIHALLSDTNPEPSSTMSYPLRNNPNHYNYQSPGFSSFPSTPNMMSNMEYTNGFPVLNPQNNFKLCCWPSGFINPKYSFKDSDYDDMDKLFNMLVSLDLYSYMYVVENVLDQRLKEELAQINC